jgi:hypothetical protein
MASFRWAPGYSDGAGRCHLVHAHVPEATPAGRILFATFPAMPQSCLKKAKDKSVTRREGPFIGESMRDPYNRRLFIRAGA